MIKYPFSFNEDPKHPINGSLELENPLPYPQGTQGSALYRPGRIRLENGTTLDLVLYHNPATAEFIYLHRYPFDRELMDLLGVPADALARKKTITLPGPALHGFPPVKADRICRGHHLSRTATAGCSDNPQAAQYRDFSHRQGRTEIWCGGIHLPCTRVLLR